MRACENDRALFSINAIEKQVSALAFQAICKFREPQKSAGFLNGPCFIPRAPCDDIKPKRMRAFILPF